MLVVTAFVSTGAKSQVVGEPVSIDDSCSYFGEEMVDVVYTFQSVTEAEDIVVSIVDVSGLVPRFTTRAAGVPNAAAIIQGSQRMLLYNPGFINDLRAQVQNRWAPISVIAHEVGHHLNGHTLETGGSRPGIELEADYFSGFVLQQMGADLDDAQIAINILGSDVGSDTHPAKRDRLAAIAAGWSKACERDDDCSTFGGSPPVVSDAGGDSCAYANDGVCDEPGICPAGSDSTDCRGQVASRPTGADSCQYANDGVCDEPGICSPGTDTADCSGQVASRPTGADSCLYANDGVCDEPNLCPVGSDTADCRGQTASPQTGDDSCLYANDGECDEPGICTDSADCRGQVASRPTGADSCVYASDGVCDEPGLCSVGSDSSDCRAFSLRPASGSYDAVTLKNQCPTDEIKVAVRFQDAVSDEWKNAYWLRIGYDEATPPFFTKNRYWYYVAVSLRDGGTWNAQADDHATVEIGGETYRLGKMDSGEEWGEQSRNLTCD